jgi:triose/dihydroxyacetone kinase / FAD-AMP lyase (cyclizing)
MRVDGSVNRLFLAERPQRVVAGLAATAQLNGGLEYSADPAYLWNSSPAPARRVGLVSGGGAGHEPMHAGFVGLGGLDGACPGEIFTSPHNRQIYEVSAKVALPEGVLQIVKNYTGDVLNFSIAAERLRADGIRVEQVLVDDDWGSRDAGDVGRRGTAATVVVEKVLGAAADAGLSLDELTTLGRRVVERSRTIAVASESHRSPGDGSRAFDVADEVLEYGVGIHGEPARERIEAVDLSTLLDRMVEELIEGVTAPVVVLVNGLGGTGQLELLNISDATARSLAHRGIEIRSLTSGEFCTALDMRGFSITVVTADDEWLPYWFAGHDTALPRPQEFPGITAMSASDSASRDTATPSRWLAGLAERVEDRRPRFNALDQAAGDGDFGDNLMAGVSKALLRGAVDDDTAADIDHLAKAYLDDVGGSSGPLLGLVFGGVAAQINSELLTGLKEALTAVQRAGGAQRGDRTLVDALAGIVDDADRRGQSAVDEQALRAGIAAADGTRHMVARRGRAAYVGDRALGQPDAGAVAVAWLAVALWAAVTGADASALESEADDLLR